MVEQFQVVKNEQRYIIKIIRYLIEVYNNVLSVCGLRNGNLASSRCFGNVIIYEINGNRCKHIHTLQGHTYWVTKVIELKDGRLSSCFFDKIIRICDENYEPIQSLNGHTYDIVSIIEMNDYIIYVGADNALRIWNKKTYECIKKY